MSLSSGPLPPGMPAVSLSGGSGAQMPAVSLSGGSVASHGTLPGAKMASAGRAMYMQGYSTPNGPVGVTVPAHLGSRVVGTPSPPGGYAARPPQVMTAYTSPMTSVAGALSSPRALVRAPAPGPGMAASQPAATWRAGAGAIAPRPPLPSAMAVSSPSMPRLEGLVTAPPALVSPRGAHASGLCASPRRPGTSMAALPGATASSLALPVPSSPRGDLVRRPGAPLAPQSPSRSSDCLAPAAPVISGAVASQAGSAAPPSPAGAVLRSAATPPPYGADGADAISRELGGLRADVDTLRGMLSHAEIQREKAEQSTCAASDRCEKLQICKEAAEAQLQEAMALADRLRSELAESRRREQEARAQVEQMRQYATSGATALAAANGPLTLGGGRAVGASATSTTAGASLSTRAAADEDGGSRRQPPIDCREASAANGYGSYVARQVRDWDDLGQADPDPAQHAASGGSQGGSHSGRSAAASAKTDELDEMWCAVLQRFPHYPHWALIKERRGVYRMGRPEGRQIFCRVSRGGLQVRIGGGWMAAVPFLARHGPSHMGPGANGEELLDADGDMREAVSEHLASMLEVTPAMERLLLPTKSWTQRVRQGPPDVVGSSGPPLSARHRGADER